MLRAQLVQAVVALAPLYKVTSERKGEEFEIVLTLGVHHRAFSCPLEQPSGPLAIRDEEAAELLEDVAHFVEENEA